MMKRWVWGTLAAFLLSLVVMGWAQAEENDQGEPAKQAGPESAAKPETGRKEIPVIGTGYPFSGPDTGFGVGASAIYRDMAGKVGRDQTFSVSYTQTKYKSFSLDWSEPDFLRKGPRADIYLSFDNKPSRRFYGFGNDTDIKDICNYGWDMYEIRPAYIYPSGASKFRAKLQYDYQFVKPHDGTLDDPNDLLYSRPISQLYPEVFHSRQFDGGATAGPGLFLINDTRKDRFQLGGDREDKIYPVAGGYREVQLHYFGPMVGSRFEYMKEQLDLRQYFGFFKDNTVLVLRGKLVAVQGDVPFWNLPSFGGGNDLRGFYDGRFRGNDSSQYNIELRQGIAPNTKVSLFKGAVVLKYPFLFAFFEAGRVYDSYTRFGADWDKDYHPSYGGGFRFIVSPSVVIRIELAFSPEQTKLLGGFILNASEPF